jgi:hypothetical protein
LDDDPVDAGVGERINQECSKMISRLNVAVDWVYPAADLHLARPNESADPDCRVVSHPCAMFHPLRCPAAA